MTIDILTKRIRDLRERVLDTAAESLRANDERKYRGLSDVAVRLTALIPSDDAANQTTAVNQPAPESALTVREKAKAEYESVSQPVSASQTIPIFARRRGVTYEAELDTSRISDGGRGACVWYEGQWMTTSKAADRITGTAVNGWRNFWRYERSDGSKGPIQELRNRQSHSNDADSVSW